VLLLLPPSVGCGAERRLSPAALLHEQRLEEDPQKEKHSQEEDLEKGPKVGEAEILTALYQSMWQYALLPNVMCISYNCTL